MGMRHYLRITEESTFNGGPKSSPTASEQIWIDYGDQSPNVAHTPTIWTHSSVMPIYGPSDRLSGSDQYEVAGSFSTRLFHEQAAFWDKAVWKPQVSGSVGYLKSYSVDRVIVTNDASAEIKDRYNGCKFAQCTIAGSNQGNMPQIGMNLNFLGAERIEGEALSGFASSPGCVVYPVKLYRFSQHTLTLGGTDMSTWCRNWTLTIAHQLSKLIHKGAFPTDIRWNGWKPNIAANWDLKDKTFHDKYQAIRSSFSSAKMDPSTLVLQYSGSESVTFSLRNLLLTALPNQTPVGGDFTQAATAKPHFDCTNLLMSVTVANP